LAETLPDVRIFLSGRRQFRDLFAAQPGVAGFIPAPPSGIASLLRCLASSGNFPPEPGLPGRFDLGLLLTNSFSSAIWMWRIGVGNRIGYDRDCRRLFLTHPVSCGVIEKSWHSIHYYLWLARLAETEAVKSLETERREIASMAEYFSPKLKVGQVERLAAAGMLDQAGLAGRPYAVIAPASAFGQVKDWPPEHYRRLIEGLNRYFSLPVLITGGNNQLHVCAGIAMKQKAAVNLAGKTSIGSFAALLAGAQLFVGGDSGGAHMAAALGVPTLVIFGVTNPYRTCPVGVKVRIFGGTDCDSDLRSGRNREKAAQILAGILPVQLLAAASDFLGRKCAGG
jgi:heptosyltransferase-2